MILRVLPLRRGTAGNNRSMDRQGETAGERRTEDEWWHELYEEGVPDAGPQRAGDTLDDRFASVARTVDEETDPAPAGSARPSRRSAAEPYDQMRDPDYPPPTASGALGTTGAVAPSVAGVPGFTERRSEAPAAGRGWTDDVFAGLREDGRQAPGRRPAAPEPAEPAAAEPAVAEPEGTEPAEPSGTAAGEPGPWWESAVRAPREATDGTTRDAARPGRTEPAVAESPAAGEPGPQGTASAGPPDDAAPARPGDAGEPAPAGTPPQSPASADAAPPVTERAAEAGSDGAAPVQGAPGSPQSPVPAPPFSGQPAPPGPAEAAGPRSGETAPPPPVRPASDVPPGPARPVPPPAPAEAVGTGDEGAAQADPARPVSPGSVPPVPARPTPPAASAPVPSARPSSPDPAETTDPPPPAGAPASGAPVSGAPASAASAASAPAAGGPADSEPPPSTMRLRQVSVTDTLTDAEWARRGGKFVGGGPPVYEAEPTALPEVAPGALGDLVPDTVLDGARYGSFTLRTAATRGDSPRYRGEQRRDAVLTARFGGGDDALVFVAVATGARGVPRTDRAADSLVRWMGEAVGRSRARLSEDIRTGRRAALKGGLHRLTGRTYGLMRAQAEEFGLDPAGYTAGLRCLLLSTDPGCRTRVFFGTGPGGLFRLRGAEWQDLEPTARDGESVQEEAPPADPRLTVDLGGRPRRTAPAGPPPPGFGALVDTPDPGEPAPFAFRATEGRPGDVLLLCSPGFAEPLRGAPGLAAELGERWRGEEAPPGLAAFLADVQMRAKGFADDRGAAALWES